MNVRDIEYILALEKERNVSRAAESLFMTQPALSQFLSRLEKQIGMSIFSRTPDGLVPTYIGEKYIAMCRNILREQISFDRYVAEANELRIGKLRIGTTVHLGSYVLPPVMAKFKSHHPQVDVTFIEGTSRTIETLLREKAVDVALMHLPFMEHVSDYEKIYRDRFVITFSRDHPLNGQRYRRAAEKYDYIDPRLAAKEKFVLAYPYQRVRQISDRILKHAGIEPDISLVTSSVQTALLFASQGLGVTFLPESYIRLFNCFQPPTFCYLEDEFEAYWHFIVAYPKQLSLPMIARRFIEMVKSEVSFCNEDCTVSSEP